MVLSFFFSSSSGFFHWVRVSDDQHIIQSTSFLITLVTYQAHFLNAMNCSLCCWWINNYSDHWVWQTRKILPWYFSIHNSEWGFKDFFNFGMVFCESVTFSLFCWKLVQIVCPDVTCLMVNQSKICFSYIMTVSVASKFDHYFKGVHHTKYYFKT